MKGGGGNRRWWGVVTDGVGGDDEEKGRREKRVRNERLGVVRKGVAAAGFVFFDGVFFPV